MKKANQIMQRGFGINSLPLILQTLSLLVMHIIHMKGTNLVLDEDILEEVVCIAIESGAELLSFGRHLE